MGNFSRTVNRALHAIIAVCLSCMSIFVFMNVVLRYFFNSGLTWAEEASRYLFIWLIFLGAIVAFRENAHLGVDTLVRMLSVANRRRVFIFNNVLLAVIMGLCAHGTWELTLLTVDQVSAALRVPLACVYVSGFVCSAGMTLIALNNLYRLVFRDVRENELVMTTDSEDQRLIDQALDGDEEGAKKP
ncbi:MAG: TRAP transporter small permease [Candidatus Accumulibacter sp.]|jgi:TRAP-type C4-dicarboxylate transport system permease small subunit|nr:TRAP transporter small permease [Accumulibacter sp.]